MDGTTDSDTGPDTPQESRGALDAAILAVGRSLGLFGASCADAAASLTAIRGAIDALDSSHEDAPGLADGGGAASAEDSPGVARRIRVRRGRPAAPDDYGYEGGEGETEQPVIGAGFVIPTAPARVHTEQVQRPATTHGAAVEAPRRAWDDQRIMVTAMEDYRTISLILEARFSIFGQRLVVEHVIPRESLYTIHQSDMPAEVARSLIDTIMRALHTEVRARVEAAFVRDLGDFQWPRSRGR